MKKITKRILIASAVTAGTGVVFMGVGIALGGWPGVVFTKGGIHSPYEQKTPYRQEKKEIEPFSELSLYVGSEADVVVMASKDEKYYVEYTLDGNYGKPKCELTNGKTFYCSARSQRIYDRYVRIEPRRKSIRRKILHYSLYSERNAS